MSILRVLFPFLFPTLTERHRKLVASAKSLSSDAGKTQLGIARTVARLGIRMAEAHGVQQAADAMVEGVA
jgi:hypothetical protein